jgi:hypothetical protein
MPRLNTENPKPTFFQRKQISIWGYVPVQAIQKPGWSEPIPHYMFRCPKHGYVVDYAHGYDMRLECPKCRQEKTE